MGNKNSKKKQSKNSEKKKNDLDEDEEFFDDNMPKFRVKKNQVGLEHNVLVSEYKTNPFTDYKKIKELGSGSFAHIVPSKTQCNRRSKSNERNKKNINRRRRRQ